MAWCLNFVIMMSIAATAQAEPNSIETQPPAAKSAPAAMMQAQGGIGRILQGLGRPNTVEQHEGHQPGGENIRVTPMPDDHEGGVRPIPMPIRPIRPTPEHPTPGPTIRPWPTVRPWPRPRPDYPPRPNYIPRPEYTPAPEYTPGPAETPVPSNVLPVEPQAPAEPETNVVMVEPEANNFLEDLDIKRITPQQIEAFKKQLAQKNGQLAGDLKKLLPGNDKLIDQLVAAADAGQLNPRSLQGFISALGGNLALQVQLKASGFLRHLIFNNMAMKALMSVNINLLGMNININIGWGGGWGGGVWGGFWGFPHWPWHHPIWIGPGMWWGPCGCVWPYYNPYLNGAAVLGIPYSNVAPVAGFHGNLVAKGVLLTNIGGAKVNYTVDGKRFSMNPDFQQVISRPRIVISFDRGGDFGTAQYAIGEGWYEFTPTEKGWELYENTAKITIDNSGNPFSFNYVLNNQRQSLKPGFKQAHSSKYPLSLKFSNGKGETINKVLAEGDFKIAVDKNGGLELFKPADVTVPAPIAQMAKKADEKTQNIFAQPETIPSLFGAADAGGATPQQPPKPAEPATPSLFGP